MLAIVLRTWPVMWELHWIVWYLSAYKILHPIYHTLLHLNIPVINTRHSKRGSVPVVTTAKSAVVTCAILYFVLLHFLAVVHSFIFCGDVATPSVRIGLSVTACSLSLLQGHQGESWFCFFFVCLFVVDFKMIPLNEPKYFMQHREFNYPHCYH